MVRINNFICIVKMDLWQELEGKCERQRATVVVTDANQDTQVILVPWTAPINKQGVLEKLIISNQHATDEALIKFFDADVVTSGTPGTTLPPVRGTAAAPVMPWWNLLAGTQIVLDIDTCPNIQLLSGLAVQVTNQPVHIYAQILVFARG